LSEFSCGSNSLIINSVDLQTGQFIERFSLLTERIPLGNETRTVRFRQLMVGKRGAVTSLMWVEDTSCFSGTELLKKEILNWWIWRLYFSKT